MSMNLLRRHKHAILLTALIVVALVESFSHRRVNRLVGLLACAAVVVVHVAHYLLPGASEAPLQLIYHSATLLLVGFATLVILRNIFEQQVVRVDDVLGAVCGYLLAAGAWSGLRQRFV